MRNWKKYSFEFLSIFIAVISAFALNNWNENRKNRNAEDKILSEIYFGLEKDLSDINENMLGHELGNRAATYFRNLIAGNPESTDSLILFYYSLTRDYISIQNTSGYETLKSRGLEIIRNDSLRTKIISIYEYDYNIIRKFEEEYFEMQFHQNYFKEMNQVFAKNFTYDEQKNLSGMALPMVMSESEERMILTYLWKIQTNRVFLLYYYKQTKAKIETLMAEIDKYRK